MISPILCITGIAVAALIAYLLGKSHSGSSAPQPPVNPPTPPPAPTGPVPTICIIDNVGVPGLADIVAGLQEQLSNEFLAAWGLTATLRIGQPAPGEWWLAIIANADVANALGYHDVTPEGLPLAKVFTEVAAQAGVPISGVMSHELCEMIADPEANLYASNQDGSKLVAYESADPVENDSYKSSNGTTLSNFVTPAWFESFRTSGVFDFLKRLSAPLTMTAGGYEIVATGAQIGQVFGRPEFNYASGRSRRSREHEGFLYGRHQLRMTPPSLRRRSVPHTVQFNPRPGR